MSADILPDPLSTIECDLRGLRWMPLDVNEVARSSLAAKATGDGFRAAVLLWCAAWEQVPAGSLADDEEELAFLAGFGRDLKSWGKARRWALHKFVRCSDGRLYHPLIAAKAMETLPSRQAVKEATANSVERKRMERADRKRMFGLLRDRGIVPRHDTPTSALRDMVADLGEQLMLSAPFPEVTEASRPVTENAVTGHGQVTARRETGEGEGEKKPDDDERERSISVREAPAVCAPNGLSAQLQQVCERAGIALDPSRQRWADELLRLKSWLEKGFDLESDVFPAIDRAILSLPTDDTIGSLKFLERELFGRRAKTAVKARTESGTPPANLIFDKSGEQPEMAEWRTVSASLIGAGVYRRLLDDAQLELGDETLTIVVNSSAIEQQLEASHLFRLQPLTERILRRRLTRLEVRRAA